MTTTIREFQRNFPKIRQRAKSGEAIVIADADGVRYTFKTAKRTPRPTVGALAGEVFGSLQSGVGDLASNPRHLEGLGRG